MPRGVKGSAVDPKTGEVKVSKPVQPRPVYIIYRKGAENIVNGDGTFNRDSLVNTTRTSKEALSILDKGNGTLGFFEVMAK